MNPKVYLMLLENLTISVELMIAFLCVVLVYSIFLM